MSPRRIRTAVVGLVVAVVVVPVVAALAYFTMGGESGGAARADEMAQGNTPTATVRAHTVTLVWELSGLADNADVPADGYEIRRYPAVGEAAGEPEECPLMPPLPLLEGPITVTCMIEDVPSGAWRFTMTPTLNEWRGPESERSAIVEIAPPAVALPEGAFVNALTQPTLGGLELSGFRSNEPVELTIEAEDGSTVLALDDVVVDLDGNAGLDPVTLPPDLADGRYVVQAVGTISMDVPPTAPFVVDRVAPVPVAPTPPTWSTGDVVLLLDAVDRGDVAVLRYRIGEGPDVEATELPVSVTVTSTATLRFTVTDAWDNTSAQQSFLVQIDRDPPQAGPDTTPDFVRTGHTVSNAPTDVGSGVQSVQFLTCPAAGCGPTTILALPDSTAPYTAVVTGRADGTYRLVARITDVAGNVADHDLGPFTVDNAGPTVAFVNPPDIVGTTAVTLSASAADAAAGMGTVTFEYSANGGTTWLPVGPTSAPVAGVYSATWTTATLDPTVAYTIRAVAADALGNGTTVTRNVNVFGVTSVTTTNRAATGNGSSNGNGNSPAGTIGTIERGDTVLVQWNRALRAEDVCPGWSSLTGGPVYTTSLVVRLVDGGGSQPDVLRFEAACPGGGTGRFGSITLGSGAYVGAAGAVFSGNGVNAGTVQFHALANTFTFTIPGLQTGTVANVPGATTITYVPDAARVSTSGLLAGPRISLSAVQF